MSASDEEVNEALEQYRTNDTTEVHPDIAHSQFVVYYYCAIMYYYALLVFTCLVLCTTAKWMPNGSSK